jgi:hypothetical protein
MVKNLTSMLIRFMKMTIPTTLEQWIMSVLGAFIGGAAQAASSWLGMSAAKMAGIDVPALNFKALGIILLFGGLSNLFFFLKTSPVPKCNTNAETTNSVETEKK